MRWERIRRVASRGAAGLVDEEEEASVGRGWATRRSASGWEKGGWRDGDGSGAGGESEEGQESESAQWCLGVAGYDERRRRVDSRGGYTWELA